MQRALTVCLCKLILQWEAVQEALCVAGEGALDDQGCGLMCQSLGDLRVPPDHQERRKFLHFLSTASLGRFVSFYVSQPVL